MIYSLLGEITIDWSSEWLGIVASVIILVSFLFTKQTITRLINMAGCLAFVVYALFLMPVRSYSTAFMNGALFVVHIIYLVKDFLARKKNKNATETNTEQNQTTQVNAEQVESETTGRQTKN